MQFQLLFIKIFIKILISKFEFQQKKQKKTRIYLPLTPYSLYNLVRKCMSK